VHYVAVAGEPIPLDDLMACGLSIIADGEAAVIEGQHYPQLVLALAPEEHLLSALRERAVTWTGLHAFASAGLVPPGPGRGFVVGAHRVLNPQAFQPYAEAVGAVVQSFDGTFLARAGAVTPLSGAPVPERVVVIEFPTPERAIEFYVSEAYQPLLELRLRTTEPRFTVLAKSGVVDGNHPSVRKLRHRAAAVH
jgi:uncharacterized protein (DUF1330 family)